MSSSSCIGIVFTLAFVQAGASDKTDTHDATSALRGIASEMEIRAGGAALRAKANQSRESPMLVRIVEATRADDGATTYRIQYIGLVAGDYDLRAYLERGDGSPLDMRPLPVHVRTQLSGDHGTDLFSPAQAPLLTGTQYRMILMVLVVAWLSVPVSYFVVRRLRRRPAPPPPPIVPPPSLADQLRPLVDSAIGGSLSIAERGRLELLMYSYWRARLGMDGPQAEVVMRLRHDPEAGRLLRAVEGWLHAHTSPTAPAEGEVAALLEPYRRAAAIDDEATDAAATTGDES